jgi:predicted branched-subunit amino acid permease
VTESATRTAIFRDATAIAISTGVYGIAFGAAGVAAGLGVTRTSALSLLMFSGASQFALVGVLGAGGSVLAAVAGALLLGARNGLYGLRLSGLLGLRGARRIAAAQGVIDETTAMSIGQPDRGFARLAFWTTFGLLYCCWNIGTLIGAFGAQALGDPARFGLDVAAPAAFLALLAPRLRDGGVPVAVAGGAIALATTPFLPTGVPILCAVLAVAVGWRR